MKSARSLATSLVAALLQGAGVFATNATAGPLSVVDGARHCAAAPRRRTMWQELADGGVCRVTAFGRVSAAEPPVFYQLQAYRAPAPGIEAGVDDGAAAVLLALSPDRRTLTPLDGWSGSGAVVAAPRLVTTREGRILVLPMTAAVSSRPADDAVFRVVRGRWVQVSIGGWRNGVRRPADSEQRSGNAMDWPTLRASGASWIQQDPGCCPTGDSYIAQLRLERTCLRLAHVRYGRGELSFP